jgi:hypothetical protein|nr:MAG TPA: Protein of unknown function (DUF1515) [Caudoviricetes sp.]
MSSSQDDKLDEILAISRSINNKVDLLFERVEDIDKRVQDVEQRMDKIGVRAVGAGALGGAITAVGIELIKAHFGG